MRSESELTALRGEIREVDDQLLDLLARRQQLARRVGEVKRGLDIPIKDLSVEHGVVLHARARAVELGLAEEQGEEIARLLIRYACFAQQRQPLRASSIPEQTAPSKGAANLAHSNKSILVIGGLGRMGQCFARLLTSLGHQVSVWDVRSASETETAEFELASDLPEALRAAEVVVLATPILASATWIDQIAQSATRALVFDIASLKSPLLDAIERAKLAGLRITSIHPMFGPNVQHLAGRNIILCDTGNSALTEQAAALFQGAGANLLRLPLAQHDEQMGFVLGLSHLTSLVFADTLVRSGMQFDELLKLASPSFLAQAKATEVVVGDNQDLYYEIQAHNGATPAMLEGMRQALGAYGKAIEGGDRGAFKSMMQRGRDYFHVSRDRGIQ